MLKTWIAKSRGSKVTLSVTKSAEKTMFKKNSGPSMAAPHVTGVAARVWADFPKCTSFDLRRALEQGAKNVGPVGKDIASGYGLVDLNGAYSALQQMPCAQPDSPPPVPVPAPAPQEMLNMAPQPAAEQPLPEIPAMAAAAPAPEVVAPVDVIITIPPTV